MNEDKVIEAVLTGDSDSYRLLVERYHIGLIIHCERFVKDRQIAEDIAQESFVIAYTKLSTFNSKKSRFSTWLYRIATNKAIDYLRSEKRTLPTENIEEFAEQMVPDYEADERNAELRSVVEGLRPPEYRQVVEAYYWEGKSYEQIADDMHVPLNTVRTWLRRAKLKLRSNLS